MSLNEEKIIMDESAVYRTLARLSHEIIERNADRNDVCIIGIHRRGIPLAHIIADNIRSFSGMHVDIGELDISLYRDDLTDISEQPSVKPSMIDFSVRGRTVILVDDVIFTGRTARAAMDAVMNLGRPDCIQLAVLIDRGHRELPIRGDYIGKNIPTAKSEKICVRLPEYDGETSVALIKPI